MKKQIDYEALAVLLTAACVVVSCLAIGAWLVDRGHPWFGAFAMLMAGTVRAGYESKEEES